MPPDLVQPLVIVRGDRFPFTVTLWADDAHTVPYPIDDADEYVAEIRVTTGSPKLAEFDVTVVSTNVLGLVLPAEQSGTLPWGGNELSWDLQVTWGTVPPLDVRTLAMGKILVVGDISESDGAVIGRSLRRQTPQMAVHPAGKALLQ